MTVGPLGCNCSIVADLEAKRAIVVDPGGDLDVIRARLERLGVDVAAIVHTHTHFAHVRCKAALQRTTGPAATIRQRHRWPHRHGPAPVGRLRLPPPALAYLDGPFLR